MIQGILHFVIYVIIGGIGSLLFWVVVWLAEILFCGVLFGLLTGFNRKMAIRAMRYPKRLAFCTVLYGVVVGTFNAIIIFMVTIEFLQRTGANPWLYIALSIVWSLSIHGYTQVHSTYFATSTITLILFWLKFGPFAWIIVAPITFIITLAFYLGRIKQGQEMDALINYMDSNK